MLKLTIFSGFIVNESGVEFGQGKYPGQKDKDYVWVRTMFNVNKSLSA